VIGRRPVGWHRARVTAAHMETPRARRIELEAPTWPGNDAGAHLDVRLTAPDGYQAARSYSIASSGDGTAVTLLVEEMPAGEVSPYLVHALEVGDEIEMHGPLGRYFVWTPPREGEASPPVQLIGGGSGIVPLVAMAGAHEMARDPAEFRLLYSVRSPAEVLFGPELAALRGTAVDFVYTREAPEGAAVERPRRLMRESLAAMSIPAERSPLVYICGPTRFVEAVADWLVDLGHESSAIRTERFGGTW